MKTLALIRDFLFKYGYVILIFCIILLIGKWIVQSKKIDQIVSNNAALQDTIHFSRDKNNEEVATIQSLVVSRASDLKTVVSKDKTIITLQRFVDSLSKANNKVKSAIVANTTTHDSGTTKTDIVGVQPHDTIKNGVQYVNIFPVYHTSWSERWSIGEIFANKDSISRNIKIMNEFETSVGYHRKNFLSPWIPTVTFKNLNPNTTTTEMRSVLVDPKPGHWGIGANVGGLYDPFQRKGSWGFQIGINYNLFTF